MKLLILSLAFGSAAAFSAPGGSRPMCVAEQPNQDTNVSRRRFGFKIAEVVGGCSAFLAIEPAFSKESQIEVDKANILKGYVSLVS
jgi:hypothetical protein